MKGGTSSRHQKLASLHFWEYITCFSIDRNVETEFSHSQKNSFDIHAAFLNQPSSKDETSCICKVDQCLSKGVCYTVHMGLFPGVAIEKVRQSWHQRNTQMYILFFLARYIRTCTLLWPISSNYSNQSQTCETVKGSLIHKISSIINPSLPLKKITKINNNNPTCMDPWGFPHTKPETWLPQWVKPLCGHCQRLLWQSAETHGVVINTSSSVENETFVLGQKLVNLHLSCCLQLSLIFSSVSRQQSHLCSRGKRYDGHHRQDEQG